MINNSIYESIIGSEFKQFLSCFEEVYTKGMEVALEEGKYSQEELNRFDNVYTILKHKVIIFYEDYILRGGNELLSLYDIDDTDTHPKLKDRDPRKRSKINKYTASLRDFAKKIEKSHILGAGLTSFGIGDTKNKFLVIAAAILEFLKYLESVATWVEKYMSWIDYASNLAVKFEDAARDDNTETIDPYYMYLDQRVYFYSTLKAVDSDPEKLISFLTDVGFLFKTGIDLIGMIQRLYLSLSDESFGGILNMFSARKAKPKKDSKKFENVNDLNDYVKERIEYSVHGNTGYIAITEDILTSTYQRYLSNLSSSFIDVLSFFPRTKDQERFIDMFEKGILWQSDPSE